MKKTAKTIVSVSLLLLIVLCLAACGKKEEASEAAPAGGNVTKEDLYGTWRGINGEISTVTFAKDGTYSDNAGDGLRIDGKYTVDEAAGTITVYEKEYGMVFEYYANIDGNQLTLQLNGGKARNFAKQG